MWYVGQVEEFPSAISQGKTIAELNKNLVDAAHLVLQTNKELVEKEYSEKEEIRDELVLG